MTATTRRTAVPNNVRTTAAPPVRIAGASVRRVPWIALGIVLVLTGALAFGLMVQSAGDRTGVVVATRDLEPGQILSPADLRVVDVAIDGSASTVPATQRRDLVGLTVMSRIPAGALLSRGQVARGSGLAPGTVVVGALLGPGGVPVPNLRVGDQVVVLEVRDTERTATTREPIGDATVYMVSAGAQPGTQFVSLVVDEGRAQRIADAVASQRLRLVLRPGRSG
jgi:Flp pilus assembly protein CpaB